MAKTAQFGQTQVPKDALLSPTRKEVGRSTKRSAEVCLSLFEMSVLIIH